jgi:hypothetical protein
VPELPGAWGRGRRTQPVGFCGLPAGLPPAPAPSLARPAAVTQRLTLSPPPPSPPHHNPAQIAEHVLRQHSYRAPGEDATHGPTEPGILALLGDRDCKQAHAAPVWLRGAAAALAGGGARGMEEPESLPGADTMDEFYEVRHPGGIGSPAAGDRGGGHGEGGAPRSGAVRAPC